MKVVCLLSGGIDSPVAAYVMARAGAEIVLLHMDNRPYSDDRSLEKVRRIADRLRQVSGQEMPLYSAPHGRNQKVFADRCNRLYQCVFCKHTMQLTARNLALKLGAEAIVLGDSLGQVASQTLKNIAAENAGVGFPILRPLIGYDKLEIEAIGREIGTYPLSIEPECGCKALPERVVTEADVCKASSFYEAVNADLLAESSAEDAVRLS